MTKSELATGVANALDITQKQSEYLINILLSQMTDMLKKGETLHLMGFGRFGVKKQAAKQVRNPRTGEKMRMPEKPVPYFKAGSKLKKAVNEEK